MHQYRENIYILNERRIDIIYINLIYKYWFMLRHGLRYQIKKLLL